MGGPGSVLHKHHENLSSGTQIRPTNFTFLFYSSRRKGKTTTHKAHDKSVSSIIHKREGDRGPDKGRKKTIMGTFTVKRKSFVHSSSIPRMHAELLPAPTSVPCVLLARSAVTEIIFSFSAAAVASPPPCSGARVSSSHFDEHQRNYFSTKREAPLDGRSDIYDKMLWKLNTLCTLY